MSLSHGTEGTVGKYDFYVINQIFQNFKDLYNSASWYFYKIKGGYIKSSLVRAPVKTQDKSAGFNATENEMLFGLISISIFWQI